MPGQVLMCHERTGKNKDYPDSRPWPGRADRPRCKGDLKEWVEAWGKWEANVIKDLSGFLETASEADFELAVTLMVHWSEDRRDWVCRMLELINGIHRRSSVKSEAVPPIVIDTTSPPPPPFKRPPRDP